MSAIAHGSLETGLDFEMNLYLVHCGFYDNEISDGIYESHTNFFVAAEDFAGARKRAKELDTFKNKRMHVDGIQEIIAVDGWELSLEENEGLEGETIVQNFKHRDLAPKKKETEAKNPVH